MATNYTFLQNLQAINIITNAYRKIGISGYELVPDQLQAALDNINFLFTEWSNDNVNLWTLETAFLALQPGVYKYTLPIQTQKVIQCELRNSNIQAFTNTNPILASGTAFAFDSNNTLDPAFPYQANNQPSNCFTGIPTPLKFCQQTLQRGNIGWDFGTINNQPAITNNQQVNFVGIMANTNAIYTIAIEATNGDPALPQTNWAPLYNTTPITYVSGITQWFEIANNISAYRAYRIREVTQVGAVALNIQQIYFNNNIIDYTMTEVSRYDYFSYPQKQQIGRPTVFYVSYQINPVIYFWQAPSSLYNCVMYTAQLAIPFINSYTDSLPIPPAFYEVLINGLAWKLATVYNPQATNDRKMEYQESLKIAIIKNSETTPLTIIPYGM